MTVLAFFPLYIWLPVLMLAVTPFEIVLLVFLVSRLSGWNDWARRFPAGPVAPEGAVYPGTAMRTLGRLKARYGRLLTVTVAGTDLHVAAPALIARFFPPLRLPRECVRSVGAAWFMGRDSVQVDCAVEGDRFELYLPAEAAGAVAALRPGA